MRRVSAAEFISLDGGIDPHEMTSLRELDHREGGGIEVSLLWQAADGSVYVAVVDHRLGDRFAERVDPARAREAFEHPYAQRRPAAGDRHPCAASRSRSVDASRNL